jgi:hypothetical protein
VLEKEIARAAQALRVDLLFIKSTEYLVKTSIQKPVSRIAAPHQQYMFLIDSSVWGDTSPSI